NDLDSALPYFRESIRYDELQGNIYGAAKTSGNIALAFANAGRFEEALEYMHSAQRRFESLGEGASSDVEKARRLIGEIEDALKKSQTELSFQVFEVVRNPKERPTW